MKTPLLYVLFGATSCALLFLENSGGAGAVQGLDRTGSPLSPGFCGECHSGGNYAPTLTVELLRDGNIVTRYEPGEDYTFRLTINPTNGTPERFGFQAVALQGDDNANAGIWDSAPAGFRITTLNNRKYIEHGSPRISNALQIKWQAPAAGSGSVRFYAAGNAVNNNGGESGDSPVFLMNPLIINEQTTTATFAEKSLPATIEIFPNPVVEDAHLKIDLAESGQYMLRIYDLYGKELQHKMLQLSNGSNTAMLALNDLSAGHYFVSLSDGARIATKRIVKQ